MLRQFQSCRLCQLVGVRALNCPLRLSESIYPFHLLKKVLFWGYCVNTFYHSYLVFQGKQKKNNRKTKDKGRDEKICVIEQEKAERDGCIGDGNDYETEEPEAALGKTDILEDVSDISDSVDCVPEANHPDFEDRGASPVNWDTDTSEMHPITETSCSGLSGLSSVQNGISGKSLSVMDDSSSTCSTDSVPSAATNAPYRGTSNHKNQKSPSR